MRTNWKTIEQLPSSTRIRCVHVTSDGIGMIGGFQENLETDLPIRLQTRQSFIKKYDGQLKVVYEDRGSIDLISCQGSDYYAIQSVVRSEGIGSRYYLLHSDNAGSNWQHIGRIPAASVEQLATPSPKVIWVFGASNTLLQSNDGGKVYSEVPLPNEFSWTRERMYSLQGNQIAMVGKGIHLSDGKNWRTLVSSEHWIHCLCFPYFAGDFNGVFQFGVLANQKMQLISELPADRIGVELVVDQNRVRLLTKERVASRSPDMVMFGSDNLGSGWTQSKLSLSSCVNIAGKSSGLGVNFLKTELKYAS